MRSLIFFLTFCCSYIICHAQTHALVLRPLHGFSVSQTAADSVMKGFRGLSVVNSKCIWISGQRGLVGRSVNGGKDFQWRRIEMYEKLDFRTLHAFDKKNAVVASAGTPAVILRTSNGGKTWIQCYASIDSAMFFDGFGFWNNERGLIFGDPINGIMFLMQTLDGGRTWTEIPSADCPQLVEGEAAFAASGTTIRTLPNGHVYIATGGVKSRLWHSRDYGHHWEVFETPMIQGKSSQGIFSMAWKDSLNGVIVGGDYTLPNDTTRNCFVTRDGGQTWIRPNECPRGYRSCVEYLGSGVLLASGTSGVDVCGTDGMHWSSYAGLTSANVLKSIAEGNRFASAGSSSFCVAIKSYTSPLAPPDY